MKTKKTTDSDNMLISRIHQGDQLATSLLYERHLPAVKGAILKFFRHAALCEDLAHDVFIKIFTAIENKKYKEEGLFFPWLMRITQNVCVDVVRNLRYKKDLISISTTATTEKDNDVFPAYIEIEDQDSRPDILLINKERSKILMREIAKLPKNQSEIIQRHYFEGIPYKELAKIFGLNINTAIGRSHYGREKLVQSNLLRSMI